MLTTAITAALMSMLVAFGVENPAIYAVPVWVAVKVIIVTPLLGVVMVVRRSRSERAGGVSRLLNGGTAEVGETWGRARKG